MQQDPSTTAPAPAPGSLPTVLGAATVARLEVEEVLTRYTRAIDTGEWDLLDTVFTPDAEIDYTESGGIAARFPEVKAWLAENLPVFPQRLHQLGQVSLELLPATPDRPVEAQVAAYFYNPMLLPAGPDDPGGPGRSGTVVEFGGLYHHTMVRTPDGWRSRRLHEQLVWKRGM